MRIGPYQLSSNLCLSPLAGYTNLPMRLTLRELGGLGWATTDLVNARSLLEANPNALRLVATSEKDTPLSIQLFGSVPEEMRDAAIKCEALGVHAVDINMGCPVKKVTKIGGGSAMMNDFDGTISLVSKMVEAVKIPVTVKVRLGWDAENLTAPDLARALADVGVKAIFVHGRTRAQGFSGIVNLSGIRSVVEAVKSIPVIGNGDVTTPESAQHMLNETGCAGISIGRGAFYDPWIFKRTSYFLKTGIIEEEADFNERIRVMSIHYERYCDFFGEEFGSRLFRKVAPWYAKRFGPSKPFKQSILTITSKRDYTRVLHEYIAWRSTYCDSEGKLKTEFAPAPLVSSFMQDEGERSAIPVPQGPVEWW